jgi:GTP-binding protein
LKYAQTFFLTQEPKFLFSSATFREFPDSSTPEVTFLGRSNVGKSSLLNALFGRSKKQKERLAFVSKKPGRTRVMNVYGIGGSTEGGGTRRDVRAGLSKELLEKSGGGKGDVRVRNIIGRGGLCVVDMPGYGYASREEWGKEITKYLQGRRQLRRAFILIDAEVGITKTDAQILEVLRMAGTPHQVVLSKVDKIVNIERGKSIGETKIENLLKKLEKTYDVIREKVRPEGERGAGAGVLDDILCTSTLKSLERGEWIGVDALRWAVLQAAGLQCDENGRRTTVNVDVVSGERDVASWSPQKVDIPDGLGALMQAAEDFNSRIASRR